MSYMDAAPGQPPLMWSAKGKTGSSYSTRTMPRPPMAVQSKVSGQPGWMACSKHEIHYREKCLHCPMCVGEQELAEEVTELKRALSRIEVLERDKKALEAQLSHLDSMRLAVDLMSDTDLLAIKEIAYRWQREEAPISIAIRREKFSSPHGAGVRHEVAGLRGGDIEHLCDSVGGVAMARAFSEATKIVGREGAAKMLVQAMSSHILPPDSWRDG